MTGYVLTRRARLGLFAAIDRAAELFGARVAEQVLDQLELAFVLLAAHPGLGRSRLDLCTDPKVRFWSVGRTLIAYREGGTDVEILLVERGERDWPRLFADDAR